MKRLILLLVTAFLYQPAFAQNKTPDYWKCANRSGGSWTFGRAPSSCDVDSFIAPEYVASEYAPLIFDDSKNLDSERQRYMSELYPVIREIAEYFLKQRKPEVDSEELEVFTKAVFAIGHQESYWSHYRTPVAKNIQMMRGDYGHGHGIFQVDDRWHFTAINNAAGANFVLNIIYSLEEYYAAWKRAPAQSCVKNSRDWTAIARSAYSAYNGGPAKICRWTNSKDKWAHNDQGFKTKFDGLSWEQYVDDTEKEAYLNIECAYNEGVNCKKGEVDTSPSEGVLYSHEQFGNCVYKEDEEKFYCAHENEACLISKVYQNSFSNVKKARLDVDKYPDLTFSEINSDEVCSKISGIIAKTSAVELKKNINVRGTPGGELMGVLKAGQVSQVLDFVVTDATTQDRYYKIVFGQKVGFVFAGNKSDNSSWIVVSTKKLTNQMIATSGSGVTPNDNFTSVGGEGEIEEGQVYKVLSVSTKEDQLFYKLEVGASAFDFYAGDLNLINFSEFFKISKFEDTPAPTPPQNEIRIGRLSKTIWWKKLKSCASNSCSDSGTIKGPKLTSKKVQILEEKNGWYKVEQSGNSGWIELRYIKVE